MIEVDTANLPWRGKLIAPAPGSPVWLRISGVNSWYITNLIFEKLPGSGDFDLYVRRAVPLEQQYFCDDPFLLLKLFGSKGWGEFSSSSGVLGDGDGYQDYGDEDEEAGPYWYVALLPTGKANKPIGAAVYISAAST